MEKKVYIVVSKTYVGCEEEIEIVGCFLSKESADKCFEKEKARLIEWVKGIQAELDADHENYYDNLVERVGYWNEYEDSNTYNAELQIFIEPLWD